MAISKAAYNNVFVSSSDEKINPIDNSKAYKIEFVLIGKFVLAAHRLM